MGPPVAIPGGQGWHRRHSPGAACRKEMEPAVAVGALLQLPPLAAESRALGEGDGLAVTASGVSVVLGAAAGSGGCQAGREDQPAVRTSHPSQAAFAWLLVRKQPPADASDGIYTSARKEMCLRQEQGSNQPEQRRDGLAAEKLHSHTTEKKPGPWIRFQARRRQHPLGRVGA